MICKSYTQAVDVAKIQADRSGKPWRVFRDMTLRWVSEPHTGRHYGRYEVYHGVRQLEFDFTYPSVTTGVTPYPFCRTPDRCAGRGYCPNDPACNN